MQVQAFVLHLTRAAARRENAHDLVEACRATGVFSKSALWPAVDGAALSAADLSDVVGSQLFEPTYPFPLKPGEIGCFLSHRQIWAEILRAGIDAALIIEDDAGVDPAQFAAALDLACVNIRKLGYIQFQTRPGKGPATLTDVNGPCRLSVPHLGGLRTTAQMVSRQAAERLLALSGVIDRPVDTFVQSHWHTGLRPAMIHPSGVMEIAGQLDGTTIQAGRKSLWEKLAREFQRGQYRRAVTRLSRLSPAPEAGGLADG